jgi:hypothetical protein
LDRCVSHEYNVIQSELAAFFQKIP